MPSEPCSDLHEVERSQGCETPSRHKVLSNREKKKEGWWSAGELSGWRNVNRMDPVAFLSEKKAVG